MGYQGADPLLEFRLVSFLFNQISSGCTLLDAGCGEGLVIQLARRHNFKQIIGIEVEPLLASSAKKRFRNVENIFIEEISAADFQCPKIDVLYLFNPFQNEVMEKFLASIFQLNTQIQLIYCNPVELNKFKELGYKFDGKTIDSWRCKWAVGTLKKLSD